MQVKFNILNIWYLSLHSYIVDRIKKNWWVINLINEKWTTPDERKRPVYLNTLYLKRSKIMIFHLYIG